LTPPVNEVESGVAADEVARSELMSFDRMSH
jgi:hypothetical protein